MFLNILKTKFIAQYSQNNYIMAMHAYTNRCRQITNSAEPPSLFEPLQVQEPLPLSHQQDQRSKDEHCALE